MALSFASCHRDPPAREPEPRPTASVSVPVVATPVGASDASATDAAPIQDAGVPEAAAPAAKFGPAPPTTPGHVLCGDKQCDLAKEVCCEEESAGVAGCVPKPKSGPSTDVCASVKGALTEKHCDEKADCPGNQSCCMTWSCSGGCPPIWECTAVPCWHGPVEQCLPGGTCSPGFHCAISQYSRTGTCVFDKAGVTCGKTRCSGATPVCCWSTKTLTGACSSTCNDGETPDDDVWALACTSPTDCGGYPCADFFPAPSHRSFCSGSYNVPDQSGTVFCRTIRDCPVMNMLGRPKACRADKAFPPGVKTCVYPAG